MSSTCLAIHWLFSPPFGGILTNGVTAGAIEPELAIWRRFSMYCMQSRSALMSYGLCSISNTTPSYGAPEIVSALLISPLVNGTNAGLPDSSALIAPLRRGMSAIVFSLCHEQFCDTVAARDQSLFRSVAHQHLDG